MASQTPYVFGIPIKYFVLCLLVVQNGGAVLLMRAVRALPGEAEFLTQTAVVAQEALKALLCIILILRQDGTLAGAWKNKTEVIKTAVPATLYFIQNNLQYVAVTLLDAPTYAVTYQTKMLWVAVCSVLFLDKSLERHQWCSLVLLMMGVCAVQTSQGASGGKAGQSGVMSKMFGVAMLLLAALCSSLAAVSFEKLLKGSDASVWVRNLHLAAFSLLIGVSTLSASKDSDRVAELGFFHGYTHLTWACVAMNAFGGLLVGTVISYADAIMKDIAIGASIVVSAIGSMFLFDFHLSCRFVVGVACVSYAIPMYAGRAGEIFFRTKREDHKYSPVSTQTIGIPSEDTDIPVWKDKGAQLDAEDDVG